MAVISFVSSKGGAGKSTTALVLGTTLAAQGATVTVIDGDPNAPLKSWGEGPSQNSLRIVASPGESKIAPTIDAEAAERQFVLIDLEGTASRMVSRAIGRSDLVLIPLQASALDAAEAARAVGLVTEEEQVLGRRIAMRVLFTRTSPQIPTKGEKVIAEELRRAGVPCLTTHLNERTAYKMMFMHRQSLDELDPTQHNGLLAAKANAARVAEEIVAVVRALARKEAA